jgi:hypothetical protein
MTYSEKIAVLTEAQGQIAATNAISITDADAYREAWAHTVSSVAQKIASLWPSDFE